MTPHFEKFCNEPIRNMRGVIFTEPIKDGDFRPAKINLFDWLKGLNFVLSS